MPSTSMTTKSILIETCGVPDCASLSMMVAVAVGARAMAALALGAREVDLERLHPLHLEVVAQLPSHGLYRLTPGRR